MNSAVKRIINKDIKELNKLNLSESGIYIEFDEDNMLNAKAMIIGPENTPYENGILFFKINFPANYPFSPPKINYYSTSRYRIHPNLYVGRSSDNFLGKVCLSIINTWAGPSWTSIMHISSVLLSIQSLLCENPLHNEPGFENENGERNDIYNFLVEYDTYNHLIKKNCFNIPESFEIFKPIIINHLKSNSDKIIENLKSLSEKNPIEKRVSLNIYNLSMIIKYPKLYEYLVKKFDLKS